MRKCFILVHVKESSVDQFDQVILSMRTPEQLAEIPRLVLGHGPDLASPLVSHLPLEDDIQLRLKRFGRRLWENVDIGAIKDAVAIETVGKCRLLRARGREVRAACLPRRSSLSPSVRWRDCMIHLLQCNDFLLELV